MKINDIRGIGVEHLQPGQNGAVERRGISSRPEAVSSGTDLIHLSPQARLLQKASQIIAQTPEVRPEKVAALKEAVQSGIYRVDPRRVANSLIAQMLQER